MRINGGLLYNNARNRATKNFNMKGKSIITQLNKEYNDPVHKHMKKLIALEDRIAKYKRTYEVKISVEAFYNVVHDLDFVTDIRRKCSAMVEKIIPRTHLQNMNRNMQLAPYFQDM